MKGEYSNLFFVSANPQTQEIVITFRQDIVEADPTIKAGGNEPLSTINTVIDISKIIMTIENARQLNDLLNDILAKSNSPPEEQ